jgi:hypothetical protein
MYSIFKNRILKKLKYVIAGLLLITILPGNAGIKNDGYYAFPTPDRFYSGKIVNNDTLKASYEVPDGISAEVSDILPDTTEHYIQNAREISPAAKSFNFFLSVQ